MTTATKLMNSKRRVIFKSDRGAFFVKEGDKKMYGRKAVFKKMPSGSIKKMTVNNLNSVPLAIRPMKLGAPKGPREGYILRKMTTLKPKKKTTKKPTMIISPGGTVYKTKQQLAVANFLKRIAMESPSPSPKKKVMKK